MPIYPEQVTQLLNAASQMQANGACNQLSSLPPHSPEIDAYERMVRFLPSLPLDASERAGIMKIIQGHMQRTATQLLQMRPLTT